MKYRVTWTEQREVSVIVDIDNEEINKSFGELGPVENDNDFIEDDPRWGIEEKAYDMYTSCDDSVEYSDFETIVNRSIVREE